MSNHIDLEYISQWYGANGVRRSAALARMARPVGPTGRARTAAPVVHLAARLNAATDEAVRRDLAALPGLIDHVDQLISDGVLGGQPPNVADYQIATSTSLLLTMDDTRPYLEGRLAEHHASQIVRRQLGRLPRALPATWLPAVPARA